MKPPFSPSFQDFHADIERYLKSLGKVEKNELGQAVFHGYQPAFEEMYRLYLEKDALAPLVATFRTWNWEWSYDEHLVELTRRLRQARDWPLLKSLWAAIVAKRRTNYNKTKKAHKAVPDKVPAELVEKTRGLLLEALTDLRGYAAELDEEADIADYVTMIGRVERKLNA